MLIDACDDSALLSRFASTVLLIKPKVCDLCYQQQTKVSLYSFEEHPQSAVLTAVLSVFCCILENGIEEYSSTSGGVMEEIGETLPTFLQNCDHIMLHRLMCFFENILCDWHSPCPSSPIYPQLQVALPCANHL